MTQIKVRGGGGGGGGGVLGTRLILIACMHSIGSLEIIRCHEDTCGWVSSSVRTLHCQHFLNGPNCGWVQDYKT